MQLLCVLQEDALFVASKIVHSGWQLNWQP